MTVDPHHLVIGILGGGFVVATLWYAVRRREGKAERCARVGHVHATEWREGYRQSNSTDWRYYPAVAVRHRRPACSRCRAVFGEWKETRSTGLSSVTWPSDYWAEFEEKGERWTRSWFEKETSAPVEISPDALKAFAWSFAADGTVVARQMVKLAEGEAAPHTIADEISQLAPPPGWRYETDAEFSARLLKLSEPAT